MNEENAPVTTDNAVSDVSVSGVSGIIGTVQEFLPEELVVDEALNVRPWEGDGKSEQKRIEELAETIRQEGQLQDGGAFPVANGNGVVEYHLFMGNRRRNAIALINAEKSAGEEPLKMRVRIFAPEEVGRIRRKAIHENIKRKNFSPMDLAMNIQKVRRENKWEGGKHTKDVAQYFGVSPAQITQHEKLLALPLETQAKIAETGMSSDTAQFLATAVKEEAVPAVAARAHEIAKEEHKAKAKTGAKVKAGAKAKAGADAKGKAEAKVEKKHIEKAARERAALKETRPLPKSEIVEFFAQIADSVAYGYGNSPVRKFADYFVNKYCAGLVSTSRGALALFDEMVMNEEGILYHEGTPGKEELAAMKAEEDAAMAKEKEKAKDKADAKAEPKAKAKGKKKKAA